MPPPEAKKPKKPCQFFRSQGSCVYGANCSKRHELDGDVSVKQSTYKKGSAKTGSSRIPPPAREQLIPSRSPTPPDMGAGAPNSERERPASPSEQSQAPCAFYSLGGCQEGENCTFSHQDPHPSPQFPPAKEPKTKPAQPQVRSPERPVCRHFLKGSCKQGSKCLFTHSSNGGTAIVKDTTPPRSMPTRVDRSESASPRDAPPSLAQGTLSSSYRPTSPFGYQGVVPPTPKAEPQSYPDLEIDAEDGRYDDADEVDDTDSKANGISGSLYKQSDSSSGSSSYRQTISDRDMYTDNRSPPRVYPVVLEAPRTIPYVTDIVPHWSQFADPKADGDVAFCKRLAQNQCVLREACRFRHSLTINEYALLFKDLQPNEWTISRSDTQDSIPHIPPATIASPPTPVAATIPKRSAGLAKVPCSFYPRGKCNNGDACPFAHIGTPPGNDSSSPSVLPASESSWNPKLCRNLETDGLCKFGDACRFSHDRDYSGRSRFQSGGWGDGTASREDLEEAPSDNNADDGGWGVTSGDAANWGDQTYVESDKVDDQQRWGATTEEPRESSWSGGGGGGRTNFRACYDFSAGRCSRGNHCKFAHDQSERGSARESNGLSGSEASGKKSQVCFQFQQGRCTRGTSCRFSHETAGRAPESANAVDAWGSNPTYPANESWGQVEEETEHRDDTYAEQGEEVEEEGNGAWAREGSVEPEASIADNDDSWAVKPNRQPGDALSETDGLGEPAKIQRPCKAFGQGACDLGDSCRYLHKLPEDQQPFHKDSGHSQEPATESLTSEEVVPLNNDDEATQEHHNTEEAVEEEEEETDQEPDNVPTLERFMYHCTVRFNSRCSPDAVMTAADSCKIVLANLPSDTSVAEVRGLVQSVGPVRDVALLGEEVDSATMAIEFDNHVDAMVAVKQFNDQAFGARPISARLDSRTPVFARSPLTSQILLVTWPGPTLTAWAFYDTITLAKSAATKLDKATLKDRQICANFDRPPKRGPFPVRLTGLPPSTTKADIDTLCKDPAPSVTTLGEPTYTGSPEASIRGDLARFGRVEQFRISPHDDGTFKTVAYVTMQSFTIADAAYSSLRNSTPEYLGKQTLKVQHIYLAGYRVLPQVIESIRDRLNIIRGKYKGKCKIVDFDPDGFLHTIEIRASIDESSTFAEANAELGDLVDGLLVTDEEGHSVWDPYLELSSGAKQIDKINDPSSDVPCFVHCDQRLKCVRVYGSLDGQERGKSRLLRTLKKVKERCHEIILDRPKICALIDKGLKTLLDSLGPNKVSFSIADARLTIRGTPEDLDKAKLVVSVLASSTPETTGTRSTLCPLCERVPVSPVKLTCRHAYCKACLQFALTSTSKSECAFFNCTFVDAKNAGDDGKSASVCGAPLSYVVVRDNLAITMENDYLKAAFKAFVSASNGRFFFCPTLDCLAVYRSGEEGIVVRCAVCLIDICPRCCSRIHDGSLCQESRVSTVTVG